MARREGRSWRLVRARRRFRYGYWLSRNGSHTSVEVHDPHVNECVAENPDENGRRVAPEAVGRSCCLLLPVWYAHQGRLPGFNIFDGMWDQIKHGPPVCVRLCLWNPCNFLSPSITVLMRQPGRQKERKPRATRTRPSDIGDESLGWNRDVCLGLWEMTCRPRNGFTPQCSGMC
jgi:hypothetical protein